jgi:uncharacterized protein with von Willebrand factor type A (vWA) domain
MEIFDQSEKMKEVEQEGREQLPSFSSLMGDMWAGLFKMKPELQESVAKELQLNYQLVERVSQEDAYRHFREFTRLDDFTSALGATKYSETVIGWLEEQASQNPGFREALQEGMGGKVEGLQHASDLLAEVLEKNRSSFSKALQEAGEETLQSKENIKSLLGGIHPGSGDAELKKMPLRDQLELAEKLCKLPKLKEIANLAGRFKLIAQKKQRSKYIKSVERNGVAVGNQIENLLPSELAAYSSPITHMDFMRRFIEGQTLQYDTKGTESLGKGPIVLCLDQSSSMSGQDSISKGFTLALMGIARKQNRDFALILFSSKARRAQFFKRGKINVVDLVQLAETFMGGGTDFSAPLEEAARVIETSRFHKADIIFVTDGEDQMSPQFLEYWNELRNKKGFRVLSLLIGRLDENKVRQFSNHVYTASSLMDSEAFTIFEI